MKIFISYKYTGENRAKLRKTLGELCRAVEGAGHKNYCSISMEEHFIANNIPNDEIMAYNFRELKKCDLLLAYINSDKKSEGMLLEIGYALALKKKFILAIKKSVNTTYLPEMADKVIEFSDLQDLKDQLVDLNF